MSSKKTQAFSLIELMIVVAIIGILTVVAVPMYRNYQTKSKIHTLLPVMNELMNDSMEHAVATGGFADAYDLGLSATPGSINGDAALTANLSSYVDTTTNGGLQAQDLSNGCGSKGIIKIWLNPAALGFDNSINKFLMYCYLYNVSGNVNKSCFYEYYDTSNNSGTVQDYIFGWHNANVGSSSDASNLQTYLYNTTQWNNQSCQH